MPPPSETTIRTWALRKGYTLNPDGTIPATVAEKYRKARAYRIRQSYARRNTKR